MAQQGTFWSTFAVRFGGSSAIEEILEKENFTLEEVLDHDDVIQECKYLSSNLINYLSQKEVVEQLIRYVIQPPPPPGPDSEPKEASKYPYVASELFACEVGPMLDCMFEHPELLELLFSFLDREPPIDPSCAGYFRKVVVVLIQKKYQQLVEFIQGRGIVAKLVKHIGLYSIMELLIMIGWDDGLGQVNDVQWLYKEKLIPMLVARLDPAFEKDEEVHVNAARALVDVVVKCPPSASSLLVTHLQSAPILEKIFTYMLSGCLSSLNNCLSVVIVLVQRDANRRAEFPFGDKQLDSMAMPPVIELVQKHLEFFIRLLTHPPNPTELKTQYGSLNPPFGETRMKAVELLLVLFRSNYPSVNEDLARLNVFAPVFDCFLAYPWNNMLHGLVESILRIAMDGYSEPLKKALFGEGKLIDRLIHGYHMNQEAESRHKGTRLGYMGHLLRICNAVQMAIEKDPQVRSCISEEDMKKWSEFWNEHLIAENERQQIILGGHRPEPPPRPADGMEGDGSMYLYSSYEGQEGDNVRFSFSMQPYSFDPTATDAHDDDDDDDDDGFHLPSLGYPGSSSTFDAPQHDDDDDDDWSQHFFQRASGASANTSGSNTPASGPGSHPSSVGSFPFLGDDSSDEEDDFNPRALSSSGRAAGSSPPPVSAASAAAEEAAKRSDDSDEEEKGRQEQQQNEEEEDGNLQVEEVVLSPTDSAAAQEGQGGGEGNQSSDQDATGDV